MKKPGKPKKTKKVNYAWDTNVFIAWLTDQANAPLADIEAVVREIDEGCANLILSVESYTEVMEAHHTPEELKQLDDMLSRSNVIVVTTTIAVARKARAIRDAGYKQRVPISTPDATIMAAAIVQNADILHTLEGQMLSLDGRNIVDGLRITTPCPFNGQRSFF